MQISVVSRSARRLAVSACAIAALGAALPAAASAKPVLADLRVEAGGKALAPGFSYLTDTTRIVTDTRPACGGSGDRKRIGGPTALGVLIDAVRTRPALRPLGVSDRFDFGLFVCGVGDFLSSDEAFWLYKVDHVAPEVGGDQRRVRRGDEVLWYYSDTAADRNTGDELAIAAPARAKAGGELTATVFAYDAAGERSPAAGALVRYGRQGVRTDANGVARIAAADADLRLRATRGADIPSAPVTVCVAARLRRCSAARGARIFGTPGADRFRGTGGPDVISTGRGGDRVDVRRGGADRVRCGPGLDRVRLGRGDRAARDCEIVNGRRRSGRSR